MSRLDWKNFNLQSSEARLEELAQLPVNEKVKRDWIETKFSSRVKNEKIIAQQQIRGTRLREMIKWFHCSYFGY